MVLINKHPRPNAVKSPSIRRHRIKLFLRCARIRGPVYCAVTFFYDAIDQINAILIYHDYFNGLKKERRRYRYLEPEEIIEIINLYLRGESIYSIAKRLNRPFSTVQYVLKRYGLK